MERRAKVEFLEQIRREYEFGMGTMVWKVRGCLTASDRNRQRGNLRARFRPSGRVVCAARVMLRQSSSGMITS